MQKHPETMTGVNGLAVLTAVCVVVFSTTAAAKSLVREFKGSSDMTTAEFVVDGPWLLDWRLDADFDQLVALDVTLVEAKTGRHVGRVLHTKRKGNGLKLFEEGGVYQLRISSTLARWRLRVEQLTPEEAEQYTPKKRGLQF